MKRRMFARVWPAVMIASMVTGVILFGIQDGWRFNPLSFAGMLALVIGSTGFALWFEHDIHTRADASAR